MTAPRNLVTDVAGLRVGQAHDAALASGVTVLLFDRPAVAAVAIPGGAPGGRDTRLLEPEMTVAAVDALVLSGGSAYGLDAASGVQAWLRERGRGLQVGDARIPIVPQAICFDLLNGGNKDWGRYPPYRELAYRAAEEAGPGFALGTAGGGYGATTANLKGGVGSASVVTPSGFTVGAIAVVNAVGSAVVGNGPQFWAAPWERDGEFGGLGSKPRPDAGDLVPVWKGRRQPGTTIAAVATDATLSPAEAKRLAVMATAGLARALALAFAPLDGDTVFAAATATQSGSVDLTELGNAASDCLTRAIARGVYEASALDFAAALPSWSDLYAGRST